MAYYRNHEGDVGVRYLPTPEEIRREAAAIREGWSDAERRRREGRPPEAETPEIRIAYRRSGRHTLET